MQSKAPTFVGFFVYMIMSRLSGGILSANTDNGIFKSFFNI